jgi:uncharacterized protein YdaL
MSRADVASSGRRGAWLGGRWVPFVVVGAIAAFLVLPLGRLAIGSDPDLAPTRVAVELPPAPRIPVAATLPRDAEPGVRTLVLYDRSGHWGWLGELYATMAGNLAGHFGMWDARPAVRYSRGDVERYTAVIYVGSSAGERLPADLLEDVRRTDRPVLWLGENIDQLERSDAEFRTRYGWSTAGHDQSTVPTVRYKGKSLTRWTRETNGIVRTSVADGSAARVVATAVRADRSSFPWAVRSRNLTYVGELPFAYTNETDRVLIFADLLFDALAPETRERHRALVRLEDINPRTDPKQLRAAADYLHGKGIPFGFGVSPSYRDPQGREDAPYQLRLSQAPELVAALRYLERKGGVLVGHGYTHQTDVASNPYNGVTGDDVEFYRVTESKEGEVRNVGPLPGDDTVEWSERRIVAANREFAAAGLAPPRIFEFPHYAASVRGYRAAARRFAVRWERVLYYGGVLSGGVRHDRVVSQFFPYAVRDAYGTKVLPENLGAITPSAWHSYKSRLPENLIRAARANLVVRDGFASFYFHPFLDLRYLKRAVEGIQAAGYRFVSPASL